jgi:hypothetical protein
VTMADSMEGGLPWTEAPAYIFAQIFGGIGGAMMAHAMRTSLRHIGSRRLRRLRIQPSRLRDLSATRFRVSGRRMLRGLCWRNWPGHLQRRWFFGGSSHVFRHGRNDPARTSYCSGGTGASRENYLRGQRNFACEMFGRIPSWVASWRGAYWAACRVRCAIAARSSDSV